MSQGRGMAKFRALAAMALGGLLSLSTPAAAARPPADLQALLDRLAPMAERCHADDDCFRALMRPFGPLAVTTPALPAAVANRWQNFSFGYLSARADVDPKRILDRYHCGPPCVAQRKALMIADLAAFRRLLAGFQDSRLEVVALWPAGAVRAGDDVYAAGRVRRLNRIRRLGSLDASASGPMRLAVIPAPVAAMAAALRTHGAIAIAHEPFGGVRIIHSDSLGDNETGLLFISPQAADRIDDRQLPDGGRYVAIWPIAEGVYFYIRT